MNRFQHLISSDIPFARDDAHRLLPVMVACLMAFATLLLCVAISINGALDAQSRDAIGMVQVEIPRQRADLKTIDLVRQEVMGANGVTNVDVLTSGQIEGLLKPWLGTNFSLGDLPMPTILDVRTNVVDGKTSVDIEALKRALIRIDSGIRIDDRGPWVMHVTKATALLQALVICMAFLLMGCVIGMVVLVSKTNLRLHFKAVSLLHMFGATDDYILRQFQWNSAWLAGRGAAVGVFLAAVIFLVFVTLSVEWQSAVLPEINVSFAHIAVLVLLPLFTAMIALVATRLTVQSMLEHMH